MEPRVIELELRYLEQQQLLQELSSVLYQQQRQLDRLEAELSHLKNKTAGEPGMVDTDRVDLPPHY